MENQQLNSCVVIGGSIAGLACARALSDTFERVTVVDTRAEPGAIESIVPHGDYPHALLAAGARQLEVWWPGFGAELVDAGAVVGLAHNGAWWTDGWRRMEDTAIEAPLATRALIETTTRRRVAALANVTLRYGTRITGLVLDGDRVRGVRVDGGDAIPADLVVDCSGRGSQASAWLEAAGFGRPPVTEVGIDVCYGSVALPRRAGELGGKQWLIVQNTPPHETRVGLVIAVEGDRWLVLLAGYFGDAPPRDVDGFTRFADTLPVNDIARLLRSNRPAALPSLYRVPANRRVHPEKLRRTPTGFVIAGDALARFNPIYAQGMTVAVLQAARLGELIAARGVNRKSTRAMVRAMARVADRAWVPATSGDLAYPQTTGPRTRAGAFIERYVRRAFRASTVDPIVCATLRAVGHMVEPPTTLLRPSMIARVWRGHRAWKRQRVALEVGSGERVLRSS